MALREIGRIERTLFTLDWLKNIDLRRRANAGLNKGEARNALARAIFFYRLGDPRPELRESSLSCLWPESIDCCDYSLEYALPRTSVVQLERRGVKVAPTIVTHVAPLGWEHIGLTGDYVGATESSRQRMPFDRSGDENQCSQPKCPIHSNPTNRTILTLSCLHPVILSHRSDPKNV